MRMPQHWQYSPTIPDGDARKLVTLEEDGMVWVGIRAWNTMRMCWLNGNKREEAKVLAWIGLPFPANEAGSDPGIFWKED